jgi:hypothetical protein
MADQYGGDEGSSVDSTLEMLRSLNREHHVEEPESSHQHPTIFPLVDAATGAFPESLQPYANKAILGGAGLLGGAAMRRIIPEEYQANPRQYRAAKEQLGFEQNKMATWEDSVRAAQEQHGQQVQDYQNRLAQMQAEHARLEQEHQRNLMAQRNAQLAHDYAHTLTPEDLVRQSSGPRVPINLANPPSAPLTQMPIGGEGTENYALKFGATPVEAKNVSSMSEMQRKNIPFQTSAWGAINQQNPEFGQFQESPVLLGKEGQKAVSERTAKQEAASTYEARKEEEHRKQLQKEVERRKANARIRLEAAQTAVKESADLLKESRAGLKKLGAPAEPRVSVGEATAKTDLENEIKRLQNRITQQETPYKWAKPLARAGLKFFPRFIPTVGAGMSLIEAEKAKREWEAGNRLKAAIYGAGALGGAAQATGVPLLMGLGDVLQVPAAGMAAYEAFNPEK